MDDVYEQATSFKGVTVCHSTFNQSEESTKSYISSKPGGVDGRGLGWPKLQLLFHFIQDSFMIEMLITVVDYKYILDQGFQSSGLCCQNRKPD